MLESLVYSAMRFQEESLTNEKKREGEQILISPVSVVLLMAAAIFQDPVCNDLLAADTASDDKRPSPLDV